MSDAAALMDRMYRRQRHIYDASRKFYLLGRDAAIGGLGAQPGDGVLEIACGTGRNLVKLAAAYPQARLHGLDVSRQMLATAEAATRRAGLAPRVRLAQADATDFDALALFGRPTFERVLVSYALSMIPPWRAALARALDAVAPGGTLTIVDFGDGAGLPAPFRLVLQRWLAAFDVTPRADLPLLAKTLAAERGQECEIASFARGYAVLLKLITRSRSGAP